MNRLGVHGGDRWKEEEEEEEVVTQSFGSTLSMLFREVEKMGRREGLDLRREMVERRLLNTAVASGSVSVNGRFRW